MYIHTYVHMWVVHWYLLPSVLCLSYLSSLSTFSSQSIYAKSHKLMEEAKELSVAGLVDPDLMEDEVSTLEIAFSGFTNQLDERREVILLAKDLHSRMDSVRVGCFFGLLLWVYYITVYTYYTPRACCGLSV